MQRVWGVIVDGGNHTGWLAVWSGPETINCMGAFLLKAE